jgi:hypothetical protein
MAEKINTLLDKLSDFLAHRKGLLPLLGILLVVLNAVLQFLPASGWLGDSNLLLHLGIILAILGILLAWAL